MDKLKKYIDDIEKIVTSGWDELQRDDELMKQLDILYMRAEHSNTPPCCLDVRKSYFSQIESYYCSINPNYQKKEPMSSESKYTLKPGMRLYVPDLQGHVTSENCTDELAVKALAENPGRISCFSSFPTEWKKDVAALAKDNEKTAKAPSAKEGEKK